ncbi:MAG: DUF4105 domain-containing protein [Sulfurovum sp.]|nr:DUF4105 domain-containing protein [Sulfurovum sp.]
MVELFILYFSYSSYAQNHPSYNLAEIAKKSIWLNLLHYDKNTQTSTILNKDFFLNPKGNFEPKSELLSSIHEYKKNNIQIICRFPARFYWLSKQLNWIDYPQKNSRCKEYKNWNLIQDSNSLSVFFVSGFLGNPASAFGHSFFKLNKENQNNLLDSTISYGAKLPKKYTMISYIYNGIIGGYVSSLYQYLSQFVFLLKNSYFLLL